MFFPIILYVFVTSDHVCFDTEAEIYDRSRIQAINSVASFEAVYNSSIFSNMEAINSG